MDLQSLYTQKVSSFQLKLDSAKSKALLFVIFRLLNFILIGLLVYLFWGRPVLVFSSIFGLGLLFMFLIKWHSEAERRKDYWQSIVTFYNDELKALKGEVDFANDGTRYKETYHEFANDLDLYGVGSFFQRLNRTSTSGGEHFLASSLNSNDNSDILKKQRLVIELKDNIDFKERFIGYARVNKQDLSAEALFKWFQNYEYIFSKRVLPIMIIFPVLSIAILIGYLLNLVNGIYLGGWFALGIALAGVLLKKSLKFNTQINRVADNIKSFSDILLLIEKEEFNSELLKFLQSEISDNNVTASEIMRKFTTRVDLFNNRNNLMVGIFGNGFFLWDVQTIYFVERWMEKYGSIAQNWMNSIYKMDAYLSLSIYAYNKQEFNFPEIISDASISMSASDVGHPLISQDKCVTSSVELSSDDFLIITGANMAGKSTFLRTIGLTFVMTNLGLPVFASKIKIRPQKIISSMRTEDSLNDDESYFFAELRRLRYIVDKISSGEYFIILDEILKGTNSKDKEEGSKKFVRKLVSLEASGLIATHDLGLCEIAIELKQVRNFYFDAEIKNDELFFDYKMKDGVCQNMNASFLLKKMKIV